MITVDEYIGKKFGQLTVLGFSHLRRRIPYWLVECSCGKKKATGAYSILAGRSRSCGCGIGFKTHGMSQGNRTYISWQSMLQRSHYGSVKHATRYRGRGISVCERWLKFENFLEDMGHRPARTSLDRIDGHKGYFKENCRWATYRQQALNKDYTRWIEIGGVKKCLIDWCRHYGQPQSRVWMRLKAGWPTELAFTEPSNKQRRIKDLRKLVEG